MGRRRKSDKAPDQEERVAHLNGAAYKLKSKNSGRQQWESDAATRYKNKYIDSQKRIQALIEKNYSLVRKLEFAQGKLSAYAEMTGRVSVCAGLPLEVNGINQQEKVDHLNGAAYEVKCKISESQHGASDESMRYKSMYIDSLKRILALIEENYDLVEKLGFVQGKISAYEELQDVVSAPREVIVLTASSPGASEHAIVPPKSRRTYKKRSYGRGASAINPEASE